MSGPRQLPVRFIVRIAAVCFLVLGALGCHDLLVAFPRRFLPDGLMFAAPLLVILGIVLLIASFAATKATKPMLIVGSCLAGLGGLAMLWARLAVGKGAMAEGFDFVFLFALVILLIPGLAIAAVGAVLATVHRRSGVKGTG